MIAAFLIWRRGPRGAVTPEGAWQGIGKLAARFGFGPRPTQTAYEYATALGEVLPAMRPALETVATARVEVAYGGRVLEEDRIRALRDAVHEAPGRAAAAAVPARQAPEALSGADP